MRRSEECLPFQVVLNSQYAQDTSGKSYGRFVAVASDLPVDQSPPMIETLNTVGGLIDYDPSTGIGDAVLTNYSGGTCVGTLFSSPGSTIVSQDQTNFITSSNSRHVDSVVTSFQDIAGGIRPAGRPIAPPWSSASTSSAP